jgi:hypothetical protein
MTGTEALSFVGGVVGGMGWDYSKLDVTQAALTFDSFKDASTNTISGQQIRPFVKKVIANQGKTMGPKV